MATWAQVKSWLTGRYRFVVPVLLGWVALLVVGSGQKPLETQEFAVPDLGDLATILLIVAVVGAAIVFPFIIRAERMKGEHRKGPSVWAALLVLGLVIAASAIFDFDELAVPDGGEEAPQVAVTQPSTEIVVDEPVGRDSALILIVSLVAAGAVLLWTRRRLAEALENRAVSGADEEFSLAINSAADQLLHGDDPRTAVLTAYATLEGSLAKQGHGRSRSETPTEHLGRVLARNPAIAGPAVMLGQLYEVARFSEHPITRADQELAAISLDKARQSLEPDSEVLA